MLDKKPKVDLLLVYSALSCKFNEEVYDVFALAHTGSHFRAFTQKNGSFRDEKKIVVSVRCACSDLRNPGLIVSTIDSGHLEALHGGQEGPEDEKTRAYAPFTQGSVPLIRLNNASKASSVSFDRAATRSARSRSRISAGALWS